MKKTFVFIDGGFLSKLQKHFGSNGNYHKLNHIKFSKHVAKKQGLFLEHIFYYTAPPFQDAMATPEQKKKREGYDRFKMAISKHKEVTFREGRVQRIFNENGQAVYKQKGVDTLVVMDLMDIRLQQPDMGEIILVACDSDFVPIIKHLKKQGVSSFCPPISNGKGTLPFPDATNYFNPCQSIPL